MSEKKTECCDLVRYVLAGGQLKSDSSVVKTEVKETRPNLRAACDCGGWVVVAEDV